MKNIGILAAALVAALVLGFGARAGTQTAHADVQDSVAVGCEVLGGAIDGNPDDVQSGADSLEACDGIDEADAGNLANGLGDEDGELTASDFEDIDVDDNQIEDNEGDNIRGMIYMFVFVDDDEAVTFDAPSGLNQFPVNADGSPQGLAQDYVCDTAVQDLDCDNTIADDGDGVVVSNIIDGTADATDSLTVNAEQADNPDNETSQEFLVTGVPHDVTIEAVLAKTTVETSDDASECGDDLDITDTDQFFEPNITAVKVVVTDTDDVSLTRIIAGTDIGDPTADFRLAIGSDDTDVLPIPSDAGEPGSDPSFDSGITADVGDPLGTGYFFYVCGGEDTGVATITATIDPNGDTDETTDQESADLEITVVGPPDAVALSAAPAQIACDGSATSTVTATVTDSDGNNVANGTDVNFSVVALGTANPINTTTADGKATSVITPLSNATAGVTVIVTAGDAQSSIRVDCSLPIPPTAPAGGATPTRTGTIGGPDTGNGGYLGQDSSAGFPLWTLVALALGSVALVAGGMVTRKVSK